MLYDEILERGDVECARYPELDGHEIDKPYLNLLIEHIPDSTPFDIQSVCEFTQEEGCKSVALTGNGKDFITPLVGHLLRLPFKSCWFESTVDTFSKEFPTQRIAVLAMETPDATGVDFMPFAETPRERGSLITGVVVRFLLDEHGIWNQQIKIIEPEDTDFDSFEPLELRTRVLRYIVVAAFAVHLCHWPKEVSIATITPSRQQRRFAERTGKPVCEHKTLVIRPWVKKFRSIPASGTKEEQSEQRWHAVRGHSKTWTSAAPQFGCQKCRSGEGHGTDRKLAHVGSFWIDSYFAGDRELGELSHTYNVEAPKA